MEQEFLQSCYFGINAEGRAVTEAKLRLDGKTLAQIWGKEIAEGGAFSGQNS